MKYLLLLSFVFVSFPSAVAQLQTDPAGQQLVVQAMEKVYNHEFAEAQPLVARLRVKYPQHPVVPLLQAVQTYWQNLPLSEHPTAAKHYTTLLNQCLSRGEKLLGAGGREAEASFFLLAAHGYLAMQQSDGGEFLKAVGEARRAYGFLKKGFDWTDEYPEYLFTTGLYNYYQVQYPENHAIVRPVMFFFRDGNKKLGLQQMEAGFRQGSFTRYESAYYLLYVLLKHENQPGRALAFTAALHGKFPNNPLFLTRHAEALTLTGRYAEAEPLAERLQQLKGRVYPTAGATLAGLIREKRDKNDAAATLLYQRALKAPEGERYSQDYLGMAWLGLGRIALRAGNRARARECFHKVLKVAEYDATLAEAKKWLKER